MVSGAHHRGLLGDRHLRSDTAVVKASVPCEDENRMQGSSSIPTEASPARILSREDAIRWARSLLLGGEFVVLDSETTGLGNPIDFVEVGILSNRGVPLFDSLIKPSCPIDPRAARVHGHTAESLAGERRFFDVYPDLLDVLWAKRVVVYNASYDRRVWDAAVGRLGARAALAGELAPWECAMRAFAAYVGERSKRGGYKSQKLPGAEHTAIGDAQATLRLIERMAEGD
jgi:DNA polymerase III subunit epsilon